MRILAVRLCQLLALHLIGRRRRIKAALHYGRLVQNIIAPLIARPVNVGR